MARDNQDNHDERKTFNMWTKPASGESPSLKALEKLQGDEEVSLTSEDREQIDRRSETFQERFPSVSNGEETYFP